MTAPPSTDVLPADRAAAAAARIQAGVPRSEAEQRTDLSAVRENLGDTVEELTRRVDVPARVRARRDETLERAQQLGREAQAAAARLPVPDVVRQNSRAAAAAAGAVVLAVFLVLRRRRRT